jgi:hypothetical protein
LFIDVSLYGHTFHGGLLLRHKFSSNLTSRIVSMHCQNAS